MLIQFVEADRGWLYSKQTRVLLDSTPQIMLLFATLSVIGYWKVIIEAAALLRQSDGRLRGRFSQKLCAAQAALVLFVVPTHSFGPILGMEMYEILIAITDGVMGLYT